MASFPGNAVPLRIGLVVTDQVDHGQTLRSFHVALSKNREALVSSPLTLLNCLAQLGRDLRCIAGMNVDLYNELGEQRQFPEIFEL